MMRKIYVVCPYGLVTGGPDALHQLVFYLNNLGLDASIVYADISKKNLFIPQPYKVYISDYLVLNELKDNIDNIIIVPETLTEILDKYNNCKKFIWWLSVDNDVNSTFFDKIKKITKKLFHLKNYKKIFMFKKVKNVLKHKKYNFKDINVNHMCASYYAYDYVTKNNQSNNPVYICIEPISKYFLENRGCTIKRENVVLYNPSKNFKFTKKIIKKAKNIKFKMLKGYTQQQLVELYANSKVYIDFGFFPGAERIPKEAVLNGCVLITGRYGASNYYNDVPIKDDYKFEATNDNISLIIKKIEYEFNNYDEIYHDFDDYRNVVLNLENNFIKSLIKIFKE